MGSLEDTLTEHHRMAERDTKIKQLTAEIAKLRIWLGDSEMTVSKLRAALEKILAIAHAALPHIIAGPDECDTGVALTQAINETIAEDDAALSKETK